MRGLRVLLSKVVTTIYVYPGLVINMAYNDTAVIIPLLAAGYLLAIYLLLMLAQRTIKGSRYTTNSLRDAYANYGATEQGRQKEKVEHSKVLAHQVDSPALIFAKSGQSAKATLTSTLTTSLPPKVK